jgi:predicted alpha/beta-fold hydrolase
MLLPFFGFKDRMEYYADASSIRRIPHIRTPMLFFASEDDPFIS